MEDSELRQKISDTVMEILQGADMEHTSEYQIRKQASEKLGVDLDVPELKMHVRRVVETFLVDNASQEEEQDQQQEQDDGDDDKQNKTKDKQVQEEELEPEEEERQVEKFVRKGAAKEYDDCGDPILCRLSDKRRVTLQNFRGKTLVSIREFYEKDGKELPSSKGISLTVEQWSSFKESIPAIEEAIQKLESRLM